MNGNFEISKNEVLEILTKTSWYSEVDMRKIPICSVEELRMILIRFIGEFYDISIVELRDMLLDKYTTINIIDRNEIDRRKCEMPKDYNNLFKTIVECMECDVLPCQFVLYLG